MIYIKLEGPDALPIPVLHGWPQWFCTSAITLPPPRHPDNVGLWGRRLGVRLLGMQERATISLQEKLEIVWLEVYLKAMDLDPEAGMAAYHAQKAVEEFKAEFGG